MENKLKRMFSIITEDMNNQKVNMLLKTTNEYTKNILFVGEQLMNKTRKKLKDAL